MTAIVTLPQGWSTLKVARLVRQDYADDTRAVPTVIGWEHVRQMCGCTIVVGMRLDREELTLGGVHCSEHEAAMRRALATLRTMPPSERVAVELLAEQVERELNPRGAIE